ncbi:MAG: hypothetical protein ACLGIR_08895 [Actinomycetes bacterium]
MRRLHLGIAAATLVATTGACSGPSAADLATGPAVLRALGGTDAECPGPPQDLGGGLWRCDLPRGPLTVRMIDDPEVLALTAGVLADQGGLGRLVVGEGFVLLAPDAELATAAASQLGARVVEGPDDIPVP